MSNMINFGISQINDDNIPNKWFEETSSKISSQILKYNNNFPIRRSQ